ncbi:hypothetical protein CCACVL1_00870, partial [Corchorus capsularis]
QKRSGYPLVPQLEKVSNGKPLNMKSCPPTFGYKSSSLPSRPPSPPPIASLKIADNAPTAVIR